MHNGEAGGGANGDVHSVRVGSLPFSFRGTSLGSCKPPDIARGNNQTGQRLGSAHCATQCADKGAQGCVGKMYGQAYNHST